MGMSSKMPWNFGGKSASGGFDALQYEILQEKTAVLARVGRRLEAALARLAEFDAAREPDAAKDAAVDRDGLVAQAGEALWYYVIQREVLGLGGLEAVLRDFKVPREVRLRMGLPRRP
jgi:hypothetical protein